MRYAAVFAFLIPLLLIYDHGYGQNWQSVIMLETRSGYTSNTYLNPLLPEWDRTGDTGYVMFTPIGQLRMNTDRFSSELTAGGAYEPFFDDRDAWSGIFGMAAARYRVADRVSLGVEGGGSRFTTFLDRELYWVQPVLTWSPSLFTQLRLKAGSSFRKLSADELEENEENEIGQSVMRRFDSYTIELETWPDFRWQLRTSLYGNLDDPTANVGIRGSADYRITRSLQWNLNAGLERFQFQVTAQNGGGFPPIPGPGGGEQVLSEADVLLRGGTGLTWQVHRNISLNIQADVMNYSSSATGDSFGDYQLSGGVRFSLFPRTGSRGKANVEWRQNDTQTVILNLNYSGDGQLYILGDFNNWEQPGEPLSRQSRNRYAVRLNLQPGVYEYKILLIDGNEERWIDFSEETYTVPDGFGGENGLIFID
jgi:hypothetical protein